jgi:CHAT domain-containing protein/Tfp pilus assembly protein PilF
MDVFMRTLGHCGLAVSLWLVAAAGQTPETSFSRVQDLLAEFRYSEAAAAARTLTQDLERSNRAGTLDYARALDLLARAQERAGTPFAETSKLLNQAIELKTRLAGPDDPSVAQSLNILGAQSYSARDNRQAVDSFEKALSILRKAPPAPSCVDLVDSLNGLGRPLSAMQQTPRAIDLHQEALTLLEKEFGPRHRRIANLLYSLGTDYREGGDLPKSEDAFTRALQIYDAKPIDRDLERAITAGALANVYRERGELARSEPLYIDAIRVQSYILGADNPQLIALYNNYGLNQRELGDFKGARTTFDHALEVSRAVHGEDSTITAQLLGNLGIVFVESGDLMAARDCYERALVIQEKRLGPDHQLVAAVLYSLGNVLHQLRDYEEAKKLVSRALAIFEKTIGPDNPRTAQVLGTLGGLHLDLHEYTAAQGDVERAYNILLKAVGENNIRTNAALKKIADIRMAAGDTTGAREVYRRALKIAESAQGKDNPKNGDLLERLAYAENACGAHGIALELYDHALAVWTGAFGRDYYLLAELLANKGQTLLALGRTAEALSTALESARVRRENVMIGARGIAERQALLYAAQDRGGLDLALRIASEGKAQGSDLIAVWDALIRDRALVLDEMIQRRNLAAHSAGGEIGDLWMQVSDSRDQLAAAAVRDTGGKDRAAQMIALRNAVDNAERKLALRSSTFRKLQQSRQIGFEAVRPALPPGAALVGYARSADTYVALVLRAGRPSPVAVKLASAAAVEKLVAAWRAEMDRERESLGRAAARNEKSYREAGIALRRAIWDPVSTQLANARTVYIAADAALLMVNFGTLPSGDSQYLIETGPALRMLSTERDLASPPSVRQPGELLAIGNPDFAVAPAPPPPSRGTPEGCTNFASIRFDALPASGEEAHSIAQLWRAYGGKGTELEGSRATESAFKQQAAGKRVIHIATHGFFLEERCQTAPVLRENPLLRSGLALAGANRRTVSASPRDDGILTAEEVAALDLTGTELVILSGCDTGIGVAQNGEGVLGLRRSFRIAGARTLVTSLWPVEDDDTRQWMLAFYRARFAANVSAAEAARTASMQQLRALRASAKSTHPLYWGGFIAVGN